MAYYRKRKTAAKKIQRAYRQRRMLKGNPRAPVRALRLRNIGHNTDNLKVRMSRTILRSDMVADPDNSLKCNIFFCPSRNISTAFDVNGNSNLFYHPDFAVMQTLYEQYKVTCIVMEFSRPDVWVQQTNTGSGEDVYTKYPTQEWGTEILHTRQVYKPDSTTGNIQTTTEIQPKMSIYYPTSYKEAVDDGAQRFKVVKNYKRYQKRIYKPSTWFEKRWVHKQFSDLEHAKGGIHLRIKDGIYAIPNVPTGNANVRDEQVMFNVTATVYMAYKERI